MLWDGGDIDGQVSLECWDIRGEHLAHSALTLISETVKC